MVERQSLYNWNLWSRTLTWRQLYTLSVLAFSAALVASEKFVLPAQLFFCDFFRYCRSSWLLVWFFLTIFFLSLAEPLLQFIQFSGSDVSIHLEHTLYKPQINVAKASTSSYLFSYINVGIYIYILIQIYIYIHISLYI